MSVLEVSGLNLRYGAVHAVREASLEVGPGELVVVLGANGAGKSSLMAGIMGMSKASGSVRLGGVAVSSLSTERRVRRGMVLVPEGRHLFGGMSVIENLRLGYTHTDPGNRLPLEAIFEMFPVLSERQHQQASTLSGGEQQMLALSRALVRKPDLLLLDEPSMGLAPKIVRELFATIETIHQAGTSILLVEQNARTSLQIADRSHLMESGVLGPSRRAADMLDDAHLLESYLGGAR